MQFDSVSPLSLILSGQNELCYYGLEDGFKLVDIMNRLGIDLSPRRTAELSRSLHDISQGKKQAPEVLEETRRLIDEIFADSTWQA